MTFVEGFLNLLLSFYAPTLISYHVIQRVSQQTNPLTSAASPLHPTQKNTLSKLILPIALHVSSLEEALLSVMGCTETKTLRLPHRILKTMLISPCTKVFYDFCCLLPGALSAAVAPGSLSLFCNAIIKVLVKKKKKMSS